MMGILAALVTVLAWGTWLAPSQNVPLRRQEIRTFYVATANLIVALAVALWRGSWELDAGAFWWPFAGGLVWAVSGLCAFTATANLGIAKAFGIWAPLNIVVSLVAGRVIFGEFAHPSRTQLTVLVLAVLLIVAGVVLIVAAKPGAEQQSGTRSVPRGLLGALGAGVLWGLYFVPVELAGVSPWAGALPLAIGIFAGSTVLLLLTRHGPRLAAAQDYLRVTGTGVLWSVGNFGMLMLVDAWGAGRGYTVSQLSLVVNALVGIYWLKEPAPRTRGALLTLGGCALATIGGVVIGALKS
ncbi:GRP family sugar transporter [Opitutus terrae]|uniref:Sugar transport family protein n=1 Tax=Opitutus terrae (strain DSM 11246 / JCM 15787 / PB90-1) TaxID=452637 RepID=B1ZTK6_OPITP|nr:GRP family sugar transporter [Opitutus terrae]ACB73951.1 sugar transport family protein [Opitutus terrae PB90-1]